MPTYERTARFAREFRRLPATKQAAFLAALSHFVTALRAQPPAFPGALRAERVQGSGDRALGPSDRNWRGTSARAEPRAGQRWLAARSAGARLTTMKEAPMKVTVTGPELTGSYVVAEQRDDGTLVLRPETSEEVIGQFADRPLTESEALEALDRLTEASLREEG